MWEVNLISYIYVLSLMGQSVNLLWKIAVVFSTIFLVDTKIIFRYDFEAPLKRICQTLTPEFFQHQHFFSKLVFHNIKVCSQYNFLNQVPCVCSKNNGEGHVKKSSSAVAGLLVKFLCCHQTGARDSYQWVSYKKRWKIPT